MKKIVLNSKLQSILEKVLCADDNYMYPSVVSCNIL